MTAIDVTGASSTPSRRTGRASLWLLLVGGLVLVVVLGGRPQNDVAFDPDGTGDAGLKGLRLLIEDLGAEVDLVDTEVSDDAEIVAILREDFVPTPTQQASIDRALDRGATVVVSDPFSELTPPVTRDFTSLGGSVESTQRLRPGSCDIDAIDDLAEIDVFQSFLYDVEGAEASCYGDDVEAFVTVSSAGDGTIVALGGTQPFTNELLDHGDNAALAAALLVPDESTTIDWLQPDPQAASEGSIAEQLTPGVRQGLMQLIVAFVVLAVARGRRLGRPIEESRPSQIAGSELVNAVGDLMQRTRSPGHAAALLRADTRRALCERLGLSSAADPTVVAQLVAERSGLDADRVEAALTDQPVGTDDELVRLAQEIEAIRQEALHGQHT